MPYLVSHVVVKNWINFLNHRFIDPKQLFHVERRVINDYKTKFSEFTKFNYWIVSSFTLPFSLKSHDFLFKIYFITY